MAYKLEKTIKKLGNGFFELTLNGRKYKRWSKADKPYPKEYMIKRKKDDPTRQEWVKEICEALELEYDETGYYTDCIHTDAEFDLIIPAFQGGGGAGIKNLRRKHPKKEYMMEEIFRNKKERLIKDCIELGISQEAIEEIRNKRFEKYTKEYFLIMMKEELFLDLYIQAKTGLKRAEEIVKLFELHPFYK